MKTLTSFLVPFKSGGMLRSPIGYPGGKGRVVKTLADAMPTDWVEFREPFAGGLSLCLYLMQHYPRRRFWVNDLDPFVSSFWVALKNEPERLVKTLNYYLAEFPGVQDKVDLSNWAKTLIYETTGVERAALYYIMSKTSFSSMAFAGTSALPRKFNARGVQKLEAVGRMLKGIDLKVTDFDYTELLTDDPGVISYFDPPYLISSYVYGENGIMHRGFDHRRFADAVNPLKSRWMVSYNDDLLIRRYFKKHRTHTFEVPYTMGTKRAGAELLITNYEN